MGKTAKHKRKTTLLPVCSHYIAAYCCLQSVPPSSCTLRMPGGSTHCRRCTERYLYQQSCCIPDILPFFLFLRHELDHYVIMKCKGNEEPQTNPAPRTSYHRITFHTFKIDSSSFCIYVTVKVDYPVNVKNY